MTHSFKMHGTCSTEVRFKLENGCLRDVRFKDGCDGNLKAVVKLVEGRPAAEVAEILKGIRCGQKRTSCPDQLSKAILQACGPACEGKNPDNGKQTDKKLDEGVDS